jgi:hypothetical protein
MLVYLFRDHDHGRIFAYSKDVTGRNLPSRENRKWVFVEQCAPEGEEALRHLRTRGYYLFER